MGANDTIRFSVEDRAQFASAVAFARAGLGGGKTLAEQVLRFDTGDGKITITASDGELTASADFQADVNEPGSFAVVGKKVVELLTRTKDAEHFSVAGDVDNVLFLVHRVEGNQYTEINFERLDHDLLKFAVAAVEKARPLVSTQEQQVPRGILLDALEIAAASTVKNSGEVRVDHAELRNGHLLASDGRRIVRVQTGAFHASTKLKIPVPVLGRAVQALKSLPKDRTVSAHEADAHFFLVTENRTMAVRKADADFPAAETMFERGREGPESKDPFGVERSLFQQALAEVGIGLPHGRTEIEIQIHGDEATLRTENSVGRKSKRTIKLDSGGLPNANVTFPISIDHLNATLASMKAKVVNLYHLPKTGAVLVVDVTGDRTFDAVLPFRRAQAQTGKGETTPEEQPPAALAPEGDPNRVELDDGSEIVL